MMLAKEETLHEAFKRLERSFNDLSSRINALDNQDDAIWLAAPLGEVEEGIKEIYKRAIK